MNTLKLALIASAIGMASPSFAQDLINKVPAESNMVFALNGKAFFKHADAQEVNTILSRLGFFKNLIGKNNPVQANHIEEMGIDIKSNAYISSISTDSVQYIGALFPLNNRSQFESILPKGKKIEQVNGLSTIYSSDRTARVSWDDKTLYILGGLAMDPFFRQEDVKKRFGLQDEVDQAYDLEDIDIAEPADTVSTTWEEWDPEETEIAEEVVEAAEAATEAEEEAEAMVEIDSIPAPRSIGIEPQADEFTYIDSVLEQDEYQDDYYLEYRKVQLHNDSIKNVLVSQWVDQKLNDLIAGKLGSYKSKSIRNIKDNELMRFHVDHIKDLYKYYYPTDVLYSAFGMRPTFDYGYEGVSGAAVVDGYKLKFIADVELDKEMSKIYKDMYKIKMNPSFYKFLDENALGFLTVNFNTEAYLNHLPNLVARVYGGDTDNRYTEIIDLFSNIFDVMLDEKAIAKVFKGDNLIVINGVTQKEITYTDYEYDADYNYKEIEKTKMESIPEFLWMFSSEDTRIFERLIKVAVREKGMIDNGGIYEVDTRKSDGITPYLLIHKGIVYLGNNLEKLQAIKDNSYKGTANKEFLKLVKNKPVAFVFNSKKLPEILEPMDLPISGAMGKTIDNMSEYGNIHMITDKIKGNSMKGELSIEFPHKKGNALSFLVDLINNWTMELED